MKDAVQMGDARETSAQASMYRRIVETAIEGIWEMDEQFRTTFVNARMAEMLGYVPSEMLGRCVRDFMFSEDLGDHARQMEARRAGKGAVYERRFRRKDGGELWAIVSATALTDARGRFAGSFAMLTDITDRRRVERVLAHSEAHFRLLYEESPVAYQSLDAEGRFLEINRAWLELLGYAREEVVGRWFGDFIVPGQMDLFKQRFPRLKETGVAHGVEFDLLHKRGVVVSVLIDGRVSRDEHGGFVRTHCVLYNVTDRKQAEEALRESEQKYAAAFRSSAHAIIVTRAADGQVLEVNDGFTRITGYDAAEVVGRSTLKVGFWVEEADRRKVVEELDRGQGVFNREFRFRRKGGEVIAGLFSGTMITVGRERCILSSVADISELKRAEQQMAKQIDELRRWQSVTLGREERIAELKQEVNALLERVGEPPKYRSVAGHGGVEQA